jgi:hypothetical protein
MDNITLNRSKQTVVEFDVKIEGASIEEATTKFVLHCTGFMLSVECVKVSPNSFTATIPPIPFIDKGVHDCHIEVVINNQLFTPLNGNVTVVDDVSVAVTPSPTTPKPVMKTEENEESVEDVQPRSIIQSIMAKHTQTDESVDSTADNKKDHKVREILESLNITPAPKKKTPKTSSLKRLTAAKRASAN